MKKEIKFYKTLAALSFDLTEGCNLNCTYCFTHSSHEKRLLDQNKFKQSIIDWFSNTSEKACHITWWGGEPFLEFKVMKELTKYVDKMAKKYNKNVFYNLTTNGTIINDKILQWVRDNNVSILISCDGIKEAHDMFRKFPNGDGSYDKVIKTIKMFQESKTAFNTRMSISPETIPYFYDTVKEFVNEHGIYNFAFSPVAEGNWNDDINKSFKEELDKIIDFVVEIKKEKGITINMHHIDECAKALILHKDANKMTKNPCGAGNTFFGMAIDGTIWPCHRFNKHNLSFEERIKKETCVAYYDEDNNFVDLKSSLLEEIQLLKNEIQPECVNCSVQKVRNCNGFCIATNYDLCDSLCPYSSNCTYQHIMANYTKKLMYKLIENDINLGQFFNLPSQTGNSNMSCHCYQGQFIKDNSPLLSQFLDLSKRIIQTQDEEKSKEQKALEKEVLEKTIMMLSDK